MAQTLRSKDMPKEQQHFVVDAKHMLLFLGADPSICGYRYTLDALCVIYDANGDQLAMTKCLYPTVASHYLTTSSKVERGIRHLVDKLVMGKTLVKLNQFSQYTIYTLGDNMCNGKFLYLLYTLLMSPMQKERRKQNG